MFSSLRADNKENSENRPIFVELKAIETQDFFRKVKLIFVKSGSFENFEGNVVIFHVLQLHISRVKYTKNSLNSYA